MDYGLAHGTLVLGDPIGLIRRTVPEGTKKEIGLSTGKDKLKSRGTPLTSYTENFTNVNGLIL